MREPAEHVRDVVHTVERDGEMTHVLTILNQEQLRRMTRAALRSRRVPLRLRHPQPVARPMSTTRSCFDGEVVGYEPAESTCELKGGNSNWRGPIWFPTSFLLIESLRKLGTAFGSTLEVRRRLWPGRTHPVPRPRASEIAEPTDRIFTATRRPAAGLRRVRRFQNDPHWRDLILFYEYFHGDNGAGLGASHQTGWTALVASLIDEWRD